MRDPFAHYFTLFYLLVISSAGVLAQVSISYSTDFEGETDGLPLPSPWGASTYDVVVTSSDAQSGQQSVLIPSGAPEEFVSLPFDPSSNSIVFVDYHMRMTASSEPVLPLLTTPESTAVVAMRSIGNGFGEWILLNGDGQGSGEWQPAGALVATDVSDLSSWQRISLRLDLSANLWDVYINGVLSGADLGFAEVMTSANEAILLYGDAVGPSLLDSFKLSISHPLFIDADNDGIEDAYEAANGLNAAADDRDLDLDGDGVTNLEEYMYGLDPQDSGDASSDVDLDGFGALTEIILGSNPLVFSGPVAGHVYFERWSGIKGDQVYKLTGNSAYPNSPTYTQVVQGVDLPQNIGNRFGARIRGYITPTVSGAYRFWIAANQSGQLFLSTDSSSANTSMIASVDSRTNYQEWNKYSSQQSALISLVAGQRYYFYALHKEHDDGDHFTLAWTKPDSTFEVIPLQNIASIVPNDSDLDGFPDSVEQAIIAADPNDSLVTLQDVVGSDDFDGDTLTNFQELQLGTSSLLADSDGDGMSDLFEASRAAYDPADASDGGSDYDQDGYTATVEMLLGTDPDVFDSSVAGTVILEEWHGIAGTTVQSLLTDPDYPASPDVLLALTSLDREQNSGDNLGVRVRGYIKPTVTGDYQFQLASDDSGEFWLSADNNPLNRALEASVNGYTGYTEWTKYSSQTSSVIYLESGQSYYFELYMKEGGGGDHLRLRWIRPDSVTEIVPLTALSSYAPNDVDQDWLPDTIEQSIVDADPNDALQTIWDLLPSDDSDSDGLTNLEEINLGLSLTNPDSDGDGLLDGIEQLIIGFDLNDTFQAHEDVLPDDDFDGDTVTNIQEQQIGSNPTLVNTDGTGGNDDLEWLLINADPNDSISTFADVIALGASHDFDNDGLTNVYEYFAGLSMLLQDSDGDGLNDKWEEDANYSALVNEGQAGAFGDLDNDRLANRTEVNIGSTATTADNPASIATTAKLEVNTIAITLIGRGSFTVKEVPESSALAQ